MKTYISVQHFLRNNFIRFEEIMKNYQMIALLEAKTVKNLQITSKKHGWQVINQISDINRFQVCSCVNKYYELEKLCADRQQVLLDDIKAVKVAQKGAMCIELNALKHFEAWRISQSKN
jgi:hypothetical protein